LRIVLASSSTARLRVLRDAGIDVTVMPAGIDERAEDHRFDSEGVEAYVTALAVAKAEAVLDRCKPDDVVIGADQAGVWRGQLMTKPSSVDEAVERLVGLGGEDHELVNGIAVISMRSGRRVTGVDHHTVTMRPISRDEATIYVEAFRPLDSVGAYRIEDDGVMGFISSICGSGVDGVMGLPLGLTLELISQVVDGD
jgi:septum formation protein